jgi:hypothetical protein
MMEIELNYLSGDWKCYEKENELWSIDISTSCGTLIKNNNVSEIQTFCILETLGSTEKILEFSVEGKLRIAHLTVDLMRLIQPDSMRLTFYRFGLTY